MFHQDQAQDICAPHGVVLWGVKVAAARHPINTISGLKAGIAVYDLQVLSECLRLLAG